MNRPTIARPVLRHVLSLALVLAGLGCFGNALTHAWLTATPTPNVELHQRAFYVSGLLGLCCFVLAGAAFAWLGARAKETTRPAAR